jgi:DNA-binding NtrC family response regulator
MTKRVLIVEDEIFVALEIETIVEGEGHQVSAIAADRASALAAAAASDIALVDLNLRDGATVPEIGRILARDYGVRIIYVTANPAQIGSAADAALGFITKPFHNTTIRHALALAAEDVPDPLEVSIAGFTPFLPQAVASRAAAHRP